MGKGQKGKQAAAPINQCQTTSFPFGKGLEASPKVLCRCSAEVCVVPLHLHSVFPTPDSVFSLSSTDEHSRIVTALFFNIRLLSGSCFSRFNSLLFLQTRRRVPGVMLIALEAGGGPCCRRTEDASREGKQKLSGRRRLILESRPAPSSAGLTERGPGAVRCCRVTPPFFFISLWFSFSQFPFLITNTAAGVSWSNGAKHKSPV